MALYRRALPAVALAGVVSLVLASCGGGDSDNGGTAGGDTDCADYEQYGDLTGKEVTVFTGIVTPEDALLEATWVPFEECTGVDIVGTFDKSFETQILVQARAGNPPDIAIVPQPGLLKQLVDTGKAVAASEETSAMVDENFSEDWKAYGTIDGTFYAPPQNSNVKSFVWYSPAEFEEKNLEIPTTLDELKELSDELAKDGRKPWCAGISSGEATGWPITDWMEDMMLRTAGPEAYDKWITHEIPFNGPEATTALDAVGEFLKNDAYVNGGFGDVKSIASTTFQDAGLPILDGNCSLHRQASFYAANWPEGTTVAEDGDVFAFYLPGETAEDKPVLGAGEFLLAFRDAPEVAAFQTFVASKEWATLAAEGGGGRAVSANKNVDLTNCDCSPIDTLSFELLTDENATFRFDGSDLMPGAVGSNSFWKEATNWITGKSTKGTLDAIEASWPK